MRLKIMILLCIAIGAATSCQKEDYADAKDMKKTNNGYVPVSFSLRLDKPMINVTDYVTMKSSKNGENKTMVSHEYKLLIAKEVNSSWIIDTIIKESFLPTNPVVTQYIYLTENASLPTVDLELRPGHYKAVFFTGSRNLNWMESSVKAGMKIDPDQPPMFCYYQTAGSGYVNTGEKQLSEEIFTGVEEFTIDKNDTLSNYQRTIHKTIQLQRKVSKFRIFIKSEPTDSGNEYYLTQGMPAIKAIMTTAPGTYFCSGLDVWGDPYYDTNYPLSSMVYCTYTLQHSVVADNGSEYFIGIPNQVSAYACYFLCDVQSSLQVTVSGIDVSVNQNLPNYQYNNPIENITLNWNSINGLVFKPTDRVDESGSRTVFILDMEMVNGVPDNTLNVFGPYFEINY